MVEIQRDDTIMLRAIPFVACTMDRCLACSSHAYVLLTPLRSAVRSKCTVASVASEGRARAAQYGHRGNRSLGLFRFYRWGETSGPPLRCIGGHAAQPREGSAESGASPRGGSVCGACAALRACAGFTPSALTTAPQARTADAAPSPSKSSSAGSTHAGARQRLADCLQRFSEPARPAVAPPPAVAPAPRTSASGACPARRRETRRRASKADGGAPALSFRRRRPFSRPTAVRRVAACPGGAPPAHSAAGAPPSPACAPVVCGSALASLVTRPSSLG